MICYSCGQHVKYFPYMTPPSKTLTQLRGCEVSSICLKFIVFRVIILS